MPANRGTGYNTQIPFAVPFVYGLNANTNLVIEVKVFSRDTAATWTTDRVFAGATGTARTVGIGCGSASISSTSTGGTYVAGSTIDFTISGATPNGIALLVPSLDQKEFAPGLDLPFDLNLIGAGMDCDLLVAPQAGAITALLDAGGGASSSFAIPATYMRGSLAAQWVYLVPPTPANPAGLETTASRALFIGPRVAVPEAQYVWDL
jgi:hypothetical protein